MLTATVILLVVTVEDSNQGRNVTVTLHAIRMYLSTIWQNNRLVVDPVHLFLSLSSETEFEFRKLSFAVGHCPSPFRQWP